MTPFGPGSVSLGVHAHDLPAAEQVRDLLAQATAGFAAGVDGVTVSEHHAGNPPYLPNPVQVAAWILESAPPGGWSGGCPMLLAAPPLAHVVEDLAWLDARHPGLVGVAFVAGFVEADFAAPGHEFATRRERFQAALPDAVAALSGRPSGQLAHDRAVQAARVPVLANAEGPVGARRAAVAGAGILLGAYRSAAAAAAVFAAYQEAGGRGARVLIRRLHAGSLRAELRAELTRLHAAGGDRAQDGYLGDDPRAIGGAIAADVRVAGATGVNLRVNIAGITPAETHAQLALLPGVVAAIRAG